MDLSQYMDIFLAEANEHLELLNNNLIQLEKNPGDIGILNEIFRSAHTLKGMAATMGFDQIASLTHEMENALTLFKEGKLTVTSDVIDILLMCLDNLVSMLIKIGEQGEEPEVSPGLITALRGLVEDNQDNDALPQGDSRADSKMEFNEYELSILNAARKSNYVPYYIKIELAQGTVMKSVRAYMVFRCLEDFGQIIKCYPTVQDLEEEKFDNDFEIVILTQDDKKKIVEALEKISEVKIAAFDKLNIENISYGSQDQKSLQKTPTQSIDKEDINDSLATHGLHLRTVRVDINRLESLMNLVGELVINKTRLEQIGLTHRLTDLTEAIEQMGRLTTDLQALVMKVRMVPIGQVFNRFPRMVRDLSRELNKKVRFVMEGEETELDRTVIDEIGDPLVHLIRNALDHGIEPAKERSEIGKPETALLRLAARQEGNNVIIEVEDDGSGIDVAMLRKKAVKKGFIDPKEAELLDDKAVLDLIFQPGFSTNETVDDLSGRGVGMDVVRAKIESLNGYVDVETKKGSGTKVKIILPLTLAIIQALLITVGDEQYAIPLSAIDEITFLMLDQIKTVQNREVMLLRNTVLPLIRLNRLLNVPETNKTTDDELFVVVVHKGEQRIGLVVDQLVGQQEIVIKSLGSLLSGIPGIAGATILGNGQVSVILDINSFFE